MLLSAYMQYSPLKIQCTAILLDRMNPGLQPPPVYTLAVTSSLRAIK